MKNLLQKGKSMNAKTGISRWYRENGGFFGADYLQEYEAVIGATQTAKEVGFLVKVLHISETNLGLLVLDIPCGHGRHSVELAKLGCVVTGQDINSFFLRKAARVASLAKVPIRLVQGDMRSIPFRGQFDAVVNMFTSFGYLESQKEDVLVLKQIHKALIPGGTLVLDVINREKIIRMYCQRQETDLADGSRLLIERMFDFTSGRNIEKRSRTYKCGKKKITVTSIRMYTLVELISMLDIAGLDFKFAYGGYECEPYGLDSDRCIILAQKRRL